MPSIKCTKKLATRAGLNLSAPESDSPNDWHANIFTIDRRFYVIFCEDRSRLTCLAGPVKKTDLQNLGDLLRSSLRRTLHHEGFSETSTTFATSRIEKMDITKTNNRSVLGTINDNLWHIEMHVYDAGGVEPFGIQNFSHHVNHMPMSPLKWKYAIEEYRQNVIHAAA